MEETPPSEGDDNRSAASHGADGPESPPSTVAVSSSDEQYFANVNSTCYIIAWMECLRALPCMDELIRSHVQTETCAACALCALRQCMCSIDAKRKQADATPWQLVLAAEPELAWGREQDVTELWYLVIRCIEQNAAGHGALDTVGALARRYVHCARLCDLPPSYNHDGENATAMVIESPRGQQGRTHNARSPVCRVSGSGRA